MPCRRKKTFSLIELLVSAVILVTVLAGVLVTFMSVRQSVGRSIRRLTAVNIGRRVLDDLYAQVNASNWNSGPLSNNYTANGTIQIVPEYTTYNWNYTAAWGPGGTNYRVVTVTVIYPES